LLEALALIVFETDERVGRVVISLVLDTHQDICRVTHEYLKTDSRND
jgi:hypothetical protein